MSYNKNHPHPPTSPFQIGDRVAVTGVSAIRRPSQNRNITEKIEIDTLDELL